MKHIELTKGQVALVDDEDYSVLSAFKWHVNARTKGRFYALRREWNGVARKSTPVLMHRVIVNCPHGMVVDHINGNTLDNRRCNLRIATNQQNCSHRFGNKNNRSGHTGVWEVKPGIWRAALTFKRKRIHLGYHSSKEAAVEARRNAAVTYNAGFAAKK
jgi:hypothetical protein